MPAIDHPPTLPVHYRQYVTVTNYTVAQGY